MTIVELRDEDRANWNTFVVEHSPAVGAFLQSYEWGAFKSALHGTVLRFSIEDEGVRIGCFQMELHALPLGLSYGYAPRGPVLTKGSWQDSARVEQIFSLLGAYLKEKFSHLIFVRFEPSEREHFPMYDMRPFVHPEKYLQPRFNQVVTIDTDEALLTTFSSDIKHDIRAADRLGIAVVATAMPTQEQLAAFEGMKNDTAARSGKNIFPSMRYFSEFEKNFNAPLESTKDRPRLCFFIANNAEGKPVAMNLNLLYGDTLTYLYGASFSGSISKRAPAYLHWKTMTYAREHGFLYYDLGGVDDTNWHGLTYFKRQFGGMTLEYIGTVDAVLKPSLYKAYVLAKRLRSKS